MKQEPLYSLARKYEKWPRNEVSRHFVPKALKMQKENMVAQIQNREW